MVEVGETPEENQTYRILFDGSISDHHGSVVIGGKLINLAIPSATDSVTTSVWKKPSNWKRSG